MFFSRTSGDSFEHLGVDVARRNRVHGDVLARIFERNRLGEAEHTGLGGAVVGPDRPS
jgi:hypothetical protein